MKEPLRVCAVVVAAHRVRELDACLASLAAQEGAAWEAIVVANGAEQGVRELAERWAARCSAIRVVPCPTTSASEARNVGIRHSTAAVLYFLDDDIELPEGGLAAVAQLFEAHPDVMIAGGPNLTPPDDPPFARVTGAILASRFGTGIARPRYHSAPPHAARESDLTLCNLAARRSLFAEGFAFPSLFGGEENVLMGHAAHGGHRLWYAPELWVFHRRRTTLRGYVAQIHRYGFGRGIAIHSAPETLRLAYFVPLAFAGYLAIIPVLAPVFPPSLVPLGAYGAASLAASIGIARATRLRAASLVLGPPLFFVTHLAYATGLAKGLLRGARWDVRRLRSRKASPRSP